MSLILPRKLYCDTLFAIIMKKGVWIFKCWNLGDIIFSNLKHAINLPVVQENPDISRILRVPDVFLQPFENP